MDTIMDDAVTGSVFVQIMCSGGRIMSNVFHTVTIKRGARNGAPFMISNPGYSLKLVHDTQIEGEYVLASGGDVHETITRFDHKF